MRVGILDPSIASRNLGDEIIAQSARRELSDLFADEEMVSLPTHRIWSRKELKSARQCDFFLFAGSNVFAHKFPLNFQWILGLKSFIVLRGRVSFFGVGLWQDGTFTRLSSLLWRQILSENTHSVRDNLSREHLEKLGKRSLFTSCPTTWRLPEIIEFSQTNQKCIVTLTDYNQDSHRDKAWLAQASSFYQELVLWPQGRGDEAYLESLGLKMKSLHGNLEAFESALETGGYDYFGTRLHGGVFALQRGVRSVIVEVDNRAREMGKDLGLPVYKAHESERISKALKSPHVSIRLPSSEIEQWKQELLERAKSGRLI